MGRMHWYATLDGCCEITTIFLNNLCLFRTLNYKGLFNSINGISLWATFLIFRLCLFPYWLWQFYADVSEHPDKSVATVSYFELGFSPATTVLLLAMSTMWFMGITKGMLKALGLMSSKAGDKK